MSQDETVNEDVLSQFFLDEGNSRMLFTISNVSIEVKWGAEDSGEAFTLAGSLPALMLELIGQVVRQNMDDMPEDVRAEVEEHLAMVPDLGVETVKVLTEKP